MGLSKPKMPSLVESLGKVSIKSVSCGNEHTAALSVEGIVYTWGLNTQVALGAGSKITATDSPVLIAKLTSVA